jgi:hypothetical protein
VGSCGLFKSFGVNESVTFVFPCTTQTDRARMSKPGSSSSHPASISATEEKKPSTDSKDSKVSESRPKGFVHAVWDSLRSPPPWVTNNIRQRRSQQLLFRSCLASWATLILMLCNRSLQTLGNLCVQSNPFIMCAPLYADRNDTSLVVISGFSFLCSFLQGIRYKST